MFPGDENHFREKNMKVVDYYDGTASEYDNLHGAQQNIEHTVALERVVDRFFPNIGSVLDVGCGTGRTLGWFESRSSRLGHSTNFTGIDPSKSLLEIASTKLPQTVRLVEGFGETLPFVDEEFDICVATGILHHVENSKKVISEMFRVARLGIIISDHNNFSFGSTFARRMRLGLYACGLLNLFSFFKQGMRRQGYSEEDGWWYPYSLLNDFDIISEKSESYFIAPTRPSNSALFGNFMLSTSHIVVACLK